jgi:hypothetical protein
MNSTGWMSFIMTPMTASSPVEPAPATAVFIMK